jgi:hypothetical protein
MSFFSSLEAAAAAWFSKSATEVENFLKPLAAQILANGGTLLITSAVDAVTTAETTGGSGAQKLAAAQAKVVSDLTAGGIAIGMSAVNATIEAAVAALPKQQAQVAAAVAASPVS